MEEYSQEVEKPIKGHLDYLRWLYLEQHLEGMVEETKNFFETCGFQQLVMGHTRTWRRQADSLLDQVWSNCPQRTVKVTIESRGASDHNMVRIYVSVKDIKNSGNNIVKRMWKNLTRMNS